MLFLRSVSPTKLVALISFFGQLYFFVPFITPYLLIHELTLPQIASLQSVLLWAQLLMEVPTGVLADRIGHRWSYTIGLALLAAGEGLFYFADSYWQFVGIQVVSGTGFAFGSGSVAAIVYNSLPEVGRTQHMQRAWGYIGASIQAASLFAYGVSGFIASDLSLQRMKITLLMGFGGVGAAAVLSLLLHVRTGPPVQHQAPEVSHLRTAWSALRTNRAVHRLLLFSLITNSFAPHMLVLYQQYFLEAAVPGEWFDWALAAGSLVAIGSQARAWKLAVWFGDNWGLVIASALPAIVYLLLATTRQAELAVLLFVGLWGSIALVAPLFAGFFNEHFDDSTRATSLSLVAAIQTLYVSSVGLGIGWLADYSLNLTFVAIGTVTLLGCALMRNPVRASADTISRDVVRPDLG